MLGGLFVFVAGTADAVYVLIASRIAPRLIGAAEDVPRPGPGHGQPGRYGRHGRHGPYGRYGRYLTAASFIGLGVYTALGSPRTGK